MKITKLYFLFILLLFINPLLGGCQETETQNVTIEKTLVLPDNPNIVYHGRVDFTNPQEPQIFWAGNGLTIWFEGTSIDVILKDKEGNNYYNAIIDDNDSERVIVSCVMGEKTYSIAKNLEPGVHKLQLLRRTDSTTPLTKFKGFKIDNEKQIIEPLKQQPTLKIEFYGNSITSGHGILDETRQNNDDRATWDNYLTYAAKTARAIDADYRCISMSGIGIMVSWYPLIMPQVFDRLNPNLEGSKWDFSKWQADIVVVNLFQNDAWLINKLPEVPNDEQRIEAYFNFIQSIRAKYVNAKIVCTLGNMDASRVGSKWPGYVASAVAKCNNELNDSNVFSVPMTYKNTGGHPTVSEHQQMANVLIPFIKSKL